MTPKLILAVLLAVMTAQAGAANDPTLPRLGVVAGAVRCGWQAGRVRHRRRGQVPGAVRREREEPSGQCLDPATLRSGVEIRFTVRPAAAGSGTVRVDGLSVRAMPVKTYYASYPKDIKRTGGWEGEVTGICTIGIDGRCGSIEVVALPGMPESVRRYAKASLEGWQFEPQEIDGKPVESEFKMSLRLHTLDNVPEDFRQDKFQRLLRNK
jgi:hypothetical protein